MEDRSFINLLSEENLSKINIDPRLIDSFKRVMKKMQVYFNANGYTSEKNYQEYFNEHLLNPDSSENLSFFLNDEPTKFGATGFYNRNQKRIVIVEKIKSQNTELDKTLCHEFIHFLVMHGIANEKTADDQIKDGGFINEALTEMLTQQIYQKDRCYEPQVSMMKFANLISDKVNNYSLFLKGKIDAKAYDSANWNNFVENTMLYQKKYNGTPFLMTDAIKDEFYIATQRKLIDSKIITHRISSFSDYAEKINILNKRPVPDNEHISNFVKEMDKFLINNLGLRNPELSHILEKKLQEYREISSSYEKYGDANVYEFEINGHKIGLDEDGKFHGIPRASHQIMSSPKEGLYKVTIGGEVVNLDINQIHFSNWKEKAEERQQEIAKYFSPTAKEDIKSVEQVVKQEGFIKLEQFTLPSIEGKKSSSKIYVATYDDRIEILNNPTQIDTMENIELLEYMGITSRDPKVGVILKKPLGTIDNGIIFSKFTQKDLQSRTIQSMVLKLKPTLGQEQVSKIIEQYKLSDDYDPEDSLKVVQRFAISQYAKNEYEKMTNEQKQILYDEVVKATDNFVVSAKDEKINVSLCFGSVAFKGEKEVLVDTKGKGLYNEQFETLSKSTIAKKDNASAVIGINEDGNIIIPKGKMEPPEYSRLSVPRIETQELGKQTIDMNNTTEKIDNVNQQMDRDLEKYKQEILNGFEEELNEPDKKNSKKNIYKVEKNDDDYVR